MNEALTGFLSTIRTGAYIGLASGAAFLLYHAGRAVYDDVHTRRVQARQDRITLDDLEQQVKLSSIRTLKPDSAGRLGVAFDGTTFRDMDNLRVYTQLTTRYLEPMLERITAIQGLLQAGHGWPAAPTQERLLDAPTSTAATWEESYSMRDLLGERAPSIHNLIVGVRPTEGTGLDVVTRSLHDLMHVLTVGASGWGKSTWLRAFLYQLAKAREPVEVCAIDTSGSALNALRGWGKLRYPVARSAADACAVLEQVSQEIDDRRRHYEQYPRVENLREYNQASGQSMPPWVIVADESTHLLHHKGIGDPLRDVVQTARQYGVYLVMAGQTAKATVIDTEIRDHFSSKLCFHTSPPSSRVVLDDSGAAELHEKGRAKVQLVGTELLELQGPWVSKEEFVSSLSNGGPRYAMPVTLASEAEPQGKTRLVDDPDNIRQVCELHEQGESDTAIAREVFKHGTTFYIDRVREILEQHNNSHESEPQESPQNAGNTAGGGYVVADRLGLIVDGPKTKANRRGGTTAKVDFCDFCDRTLDTTLLTTFAECPRCHVAVCSECADASGLCPDCSKGA